MFIATGCKQSNNDQPEEATGPSKKIVAASYALQYLTQRLAGPEIEVQFLVNNEQDPKTWNPGLDDVKQIQAADLVMVNGIGAVYADWLKRVSLVRSKICNSAEAFQTEEYMFIDDHQVVHSHGPEGEHSHEYSVPYCWLDPSIAIKQAATIAEALKANYPSDANLIDENLKALEQDLNQLNQEFRAAAEKVSQTQALSINPQTKYFSRALDLDDRHLLFFSDDESDLEKSQKKIAGILGPRDFVPRFTLEGDSGMGFEDTTVSLVMASLKKQLERIATDSETVTNDLQEPKKFTQEHVWPIPSVKIDLLDHPPEKGDYLSVMRANLQLILDAAKEVEKDPSVKKDPS